MRRSIIIMLFLIALPAAAQDFLVTSTVPVPGETNVATRATVTFTFSAPVDTSARFDGEGPLAFYTLSLAKDRRIDSTYANEDRTQISFDITHLDTTDFVWILTGARSDGDEMLCNPHALSYTTRSSHGEGIVRGSVSFAIAVKSLDCFPRGIVALFDTPPDSSARLIAAANVDEDWEFEISGVRSGTYWPVVLVDWNGDGLIKPYWSRAGGVNDEIVPYDDDFDGRGDSIVVTDTSSMRIHIGVIGGPSERAAELPGTARLLQNYPNPATGGTTVVFELERPLQIAIAVYDMLGRRVAVPGSGLFTIGRHEVEWTARGAATGMYVVRLEGEDFVLALPFVIVR